MSLTAISLLMFFALKTFDRHQDKKIIAAKAELVHWQAMVKATKKRIAINE